jgi:GrpB-like predicted nucleotidyltransferase (UPF0157 family)
MMAMWPGLEIEEAAVREEEPIELVPYDPGWPLVFERWRERIAEATRSPRIEHVGSTAVPGLAAKPIVDIQVSVEAMDEEERYVPALEGLGLQLRSRDDLHRYFRPPRELPRDVQVHVCNVESDWERDHLLFRDYLRAHEAAREAYTAAKREALERWSDDRLAYTEAKTDVILTVLEAAEMWAAEIGWSVRRVA